MCGIAGFHGLGQRDDLVRMTNALQHRGPDAVGFHVDEAQRLFLGHRRLSIIDIQNGAQPMWTPDKKYGVIFNGEIYNFKELRIELEAKGHRFQSHHSDTETLLYGYKEWGSDLPNHLNGMFAFALWDVENHQLFLARDRFGEKPLYWGHARDLFAFGSELSVFAKHPAFPIEMDKLGLKKFLAYGFIPAPFSFYKNIQKLPAGCHLTYNLKTGDHQITSYWDYSITPDQRNLSIEEASEELLHLMDQAVQRRMVADVPLGVFLSGGIDSSTIAALACKQSSDHQIKTFSIGFDEASFDESAYAQEMADYLKTNHTSEIFSLNKLLNISADVLGGLDEPMGDPSLLPTYALAQMTRKHVTVALSGDGGDELLAGYDTFAALKIATTFEKFIPELARKSALRLVDLMPKSNKNMSLDYKLARALGGIGKGPALWNPQWLSPATADMISELINEPTSVDELYGDAIQHWHTAKSDNLVDRSSEYYVRFYLQDDILTKVDRAAMLNSLETRAVFLDTHVVDFLATLPADFKYRNGIRKFILKESLGKLVPKSIINRPKKGFGIPLNAWVKKLNLNDTALTAFELNTEVANRWRAHHLANKKDYRLFLWNWYVLQNHHIGNA
jgi:asparagine synthase (glutamine-hydrolysing)